METYGYKPPFNKDDWTSEVLSSYQKMRGLATKYINDVFRFSGVEILSNTRRYLAEKYNISNASEQDLIIRNVCILSIL